MRLNCVNRHNLDNHDNLVHYNIIVTIVWQF